MNTEMTGNVVSTIVREARKPTVQRLPGQEFLLVPEGYSVERTVDIPQEIEGLTVHSLESLVGYIANNIDDLPLEEMLLHVEATRVRLLSPAYPGPAMYRRECWVEAIGGYGIRGDHELFEPGFFYPSEEFIVKLQTAFVQDEGNVNELLSLVADIKEESVRQTTDDGVAQVVTVRDGVALAKEKRVPNPVTLVPWRTFREVEQPASQYLFRLQDGKQGGKPRCALFLADGWGWELQAATNIGQWLLQRLKAAECTAPAVIW